MWGPDLTADFLWMMRDLFSAVWWSLPPALVFRSLAGQNIKKWWMFIYWFLISIHMAGS